MSNPSCRRCGCTQNNACYDEERGPCAWAEADLCTHCADSIALLEELVTGVSPTDRIEKGFGDDVGEITLPMHHAEQLLKVLQHSAPIDKYRNGPVESAVITEADGSQWMIDDQQRRVPLAAVKPQDKLQDELVRKLFSYAEPLSAQIARFFAHTMADLDDFDELLAQEYKLVRRGKKGNRTYRSFDGLRKVQVQVANQIAFGPELQVAKGLIDEWLLANMDGATDELRAFVTRAFDVDKEGRVNQHELLRLRRLEITGQIWAEAMRAIADAIRPQGTKQYVRFYRRPTAEAGWTAVTIDLAQV